MKMHAGIDADRALAASGMLDTNGVHIVHTPLTALAGNVPP
jgi:hypothetical protein